MLFGTCYQFCTFKNPIFSTYFYLGARLLAWLLSPPLDSPFSPLGRLCLLPPPSLLYPTLWISLCVPDGGEHLGNWLLAGSVSLLFIPPFYPPGHLCLLPPSSLLKRLLSFRFTELSREEKGEERNRGDLEKKRDSQKWREQSSQ